MYNLFGISEDTHLVKTYFIELQYPIYSSSMYGDILSLFFCFFFHSNFKICERNPMVLQLNWTFVGKAFA